MKRFRLKSGSCPNCGHLLAAKDNYCRNCGQENHDLRIPFGHLLFEALEGVFHFDNKLFRTAKSLLFRPGFLTSQFSNGRRASYVQPVRLYVFLSFIFFLLLTFSPGKHRSDEQNILSGTMQADSSKSDQFSLSFYSLNSIELKGLSDAQIDSVMKEKGIERTRFTRYLARQLARIADGGKAEFLHNLLKSISYMMFVLMPIFALLLYLFFRKRVDYYLNCLVFSIHFHSFVFLLFTIYVVLSWFVSSVLLSFAVLLIIVVYFYIALRTVYRQSRFVTIFKMTAIGAIHLLMIFVSFLLVVLTNILLF